MSCAPHPRSASGSRRDSSRAAERCARRDAATQRRHAAWAPPDAPFSSSALGRRPCRRSAPPFQTRESNCGARHTAPRQRATGHPHAACAAAQRAQQPPGCACGAGRPRLAWRTACTRSSSPRALSGCAQPFRGQLRGPPLGTPTCAGGARPTQRAGAAERRTPRREAPVPAAAKAGLALKPRCSGLEGSARGRRAGPRT